MSAKVIEIGSFSGELASKIQAKAKTNSSVEVSSGRYTGVGVVEGNTLLKNDDIEEKWFSEEHVEGMINSCEELDSWIQDYVDGELGSVQREILVGHLECCEQCCEKMDDYRAIQILAKGLESSELPEGVGQRLRSRLADELGLSSLRSPEK